MFPKEKTLASGYSTAEEALAPLSSALPWMDRVEGDLVVPSSTFVVERGEGRGRIRYRLNVTAEMKANRFDVVLRVERLNPFELVAPLLAVGVVTAIIGFDGRQALWFVVPLVLLTSAVRCAYVWRHAEVVSEAFALPYAEPNPRRESSPRSQHGSV